MMNSTALIYGVDLRNSNLSKEFIDRFYGLYPNTIFSMSDSMEQWCGLELVGTDPHNAMFGYVYALHEGLDPKLAIRYTQRSLVRIDPDETTKLTTMIPECLDWYRIKVNDPVPQLFMWEYVNIG